MFKIGDFCKHFKGHNLVEKNIYQIVDVNVKGKDIDKNKITYTGEGNLDTADDLVVYKDIFKNLLFAREYSDLNSLLSGERQKEFNQEHRVELLNDEEIRTIKNIEFINDKIKYLDSKK